MSGMRVLVTGGAGYIGSLVSKRLLELGYEVMVLETFKFGYDSIKDLTLNSSFKILLGDIRDSELLEKAIDMNDAVIHLAGIVGDPACAVDADTAVAVNLDASINLFKILK